MKYKFVQYLLVGSLISSGTYASDNVNTKIEWVGQRGNGNLIIKFEDVINEASCANSEITIAPTNPSKDAFLSIALAAKMAKAKVNVKSVGQWCEGNVFNEDHAHGVRNLVINPKLLSGS